MAHDALGAHARDELGLTEQTSARPVQAALASAATFAVGAVLPIITVVLAPIAYASIVVAAISLVCLAGLGALAARARGASPWIGTARVAFWGAAAMALTAGVSKLFGHDGLVTPATSLDVVSTLPALRRSACDSAYRLSPSLHCR